MNFGFGNFADNALLSVLFLVATYLFGSIPFSALIPKLFGVDVLSKGSKNPGFTNVLRTAGFKIALLCLVFDMLKGFLPVYLCYRLSGETYSISSSFIPQTILGMVAVIGHCHSIFLRFKGGKGAATTAGFILALSPKIFLIITVVQLFLIFTTKYMSVATMTSAITIPVSAYFIYGAKYIYVLLFLMVFIFWKHKENIKRLLAGKENKITVKK